jgi:hypothetical protein
MEGDGASETCSKLKNGFNSPWITRLERLVARGLTASPRTGIAENTQICLDTPLFVLR